MSENNPPSFIKPREQNTTSLLELRRLAIQARDLDATIKDLEERVRNYKIERERLLTSTLVDAMNDAGVPALTLDAEGNNPKVEIAIKPYYAANIAAGWPEDRRQAAFAWLDNNGFGDLIKTEVTVPFAREDRDNAKDLISELEAQGHNVQASETVHAQTLTAFVKSEIEKGNQNLPLEVLGATVGRKAKITIKE